MDRNAKLSLIIASAVVALLALVGFVLDSASDPNPGATTPAATATASKTATQAAPTATATETATAAPTTKAPEVPEYDLTITATQLTSTKYYVRIVNNSVSSQTYSILYFSGVAADGKIVELDWNLEADELSGGEIQPGEYVEGSVSFKAPVSKIRFYNFSDTITLTV